MMPLWGVPLRTSLLAERIELARLFTFEISSAKQTYRMRQEVLYNHHSLIALIDTIEWLWHIFISQWACFVRKLLKSTSLFQINTTEMLCCHSHRSDYLIDKTEACWHCKIWVEIWGPLISCCTQQINVRAVVWINRPKPCLLLTWVYRPWYL